MKSHAVRLTEAEYSGLNASFPPGAGRALIGERAEEIARIHLARQFPGCRFLVPESHADLKIDFGDDSAPLLIQVRGSAASTPAPRPNEPSGQPARLHRVESEIPVFHVCSVFDPVPTLHMQVPGRGSGRARDGGRSRGKTQKPGPAPTKPAHPDTARNTGERAPEPARPAAPAPLPVSAPSHGARGSSSALGIKPRRLRDYLANHHLALVSIAFVDFARIVGAQLPVSALRDAAFWEDPASTSPWPAAWKEAGFVVDAFRLARDGGWVRFRKAD